MTEGRRPRVVFDCMTYLQGAVSPNGPAAACLRLLDQGVIALYFSEDILREITNVLSRPKLRQKNPLLTDERVREFIEQIRRFGTHIDPVPIRFTYPRDPKDEPYLNLALACDSDYLVTWDNDLLDLMTATASEAVDFRAFAPVWRSSLLPHSFGPSRDRHSPSRKIQPSGMPAKMNHSSIRGHSEFLTEWIARIMCQESLRRDVDPNLGTLCDLPNGPFNRYGRSPGRIPRATDEDDRSGLGRRLRG